MSPPRPECHASGMRFASSLFRPHRAAVEVGMLALLYAGYEAVRGTGDTSLSVARAHTADIVSLERSLHLFGERAVQEWSHAVPLLPMLLGLAYMSLHFGATTVALRWVYRERREAFPLVRTTLIASTALALVGYVLYPAAPPRLAGLGFADTVTSHTGLNLSSNLLGSFYNPLAAVPSLHFGYALIVGAALVALARRRWVRVFGAVYPAFMLFDIVATGNHFFFDAAAGAITVVAGWWIARALLRDRHPAMRLGALPA
jgi:PAP2 superfamily protein